MHFIVQLVWHYTEALPFCKLLNLHMIPYFNKKVKHFIAFSHFYFFLFLLFSESIALSSAPKNKTSVTTYSHSASPKNAPTLP